MSLQLRERHVSFDDAAPLGRLRLVGHERGVCGVYFDDHKPAPAFSGDVVDHDEVLDALAVELGEFFAGARRVFTVPLVFLGTDFQLSVWSALQEIPYGETRSYVEVARGLGSVDAVRAVATANAHNPLSIVVPCHRVVGKDGNLTGYAGGMARKRWLLDHETKFGGRPRQPSLF